MKVPFVILIFMGTVFCQLNLKNTICPSYKCKESNKGDICMEPIRDNKTNKIVYNIMPCKDTNSICDINSESEIKQCKKNTDVKTLYPGEYCKDDGQCLAGNCTKNICTVNNTNCTSDIDCSPKFFCNTENNKNGTCKPLVEIGHDCNKSSKCVVTAICNETNLTKGRCVPIGSISEGGSSSTPFACSTFFMENNICTKGYEYSPEDKDAYQQCPKSGSCIYKKNGKTITRNCACGFSDGGNKYCEPGAESLDVSKVIFCYKIVYRVRKEN